MPNRSISEVLRAALNKAIDSGLTFRQIERETGVLRQSLMKFARGETSLVLDKADALAIYLGFELKPHKSSRKD